MFRGQNNSSSLSNLCSYIDIIEFIANQFQRKIWGNGFILHSEDDKINNVLVDFQRDNDLLKYFQENEKAMSIQGKVVPVLVESQDGRVYIDKADPYFIYNTRVASALGTKETIAATVYRRFYHGDATFAIVEEYTRVKIKRYLAEFTLNGSDAVMIGATTEAIPKEYAIKKGEQNPFKGFVPVWEFLNLPRYPLPGRDTWNFYSDWEPAKGFIQSAQYTFIQKIKELFMNKSRAFGVLSSKQQQDYITGANQEASSIFAQGQKINFSNDLFIKAEPGVAGENSGKTIEIQRGDPKLNEYNNSIAFDIQMAMKLAGLGDDNSGGDYKNETTQYSNKSGELETIVQKRLLRQNQYTMIIDKILIHKGVWDGKGERPYTFEIKDNTTLNNRAIIDDCIAMLGAGLIDKITAYSKINGVNIEEATEAIEKITTNISNDQEAQMELANKMGMPNDTPQDLKDQETSDFSNGDGNE